MIRAHVDTPWSQDPDGTYTPALPLDTDFALKGWKDVTGEEWHEFPPGSGNRVKGGNYALATGQAKTNAMDYLTIEIQVEDEQTLIDIDAKDEYFVYFDEDIPAENVQARAAPYRDKNSTPAANTWGQYRSRLARRGYSQAWIDKYVDKREIMWGDHDLNVRSGYLGTDVVIFPEPEVNLPTLADYLQDQGWDAEIDGDRITITDHDQVYEAVQSWLLGCDYSALNNGPLERDICAGVQEQFFCGNGCV